MKQEFVKTPILGQPVKSDPNSVPETGTDFLFNSMLYLMNKAVGILSMNTYPIFLLSLNL